MPYVQAGSSSRLVTLTASTSTQVCSLQPIHRRRTQLIITNSSTSGSVTLHKSEAAITTNLTGIVLQPNGMYGESTDGGYLCWQGPIQAYTTSGGTLSIVESFEDLI